MCQRWILSVVAVPESSAERGCCCCVEKTCPTTIQSTWTWRENTLSVSHTLTPNCWGSEKLREDSQGLCEIEKRSFVLWQQIASASSNWNESYFTSSSMCVRVGVLVWKWHLLTDNQAVGSSFPLQFPAFIESTILFCCLCSLVRAPPASWPTNQPNRQPASHPSIHSTNHSDSPSGCFGFFRVPLNVSLCYAVVVVVVLVVIQRLDHLLCCLVYLSISNCVSSFVVIRCVYWTRALKQYKLIEFFTKKGGLWIFFIFFLNLDRIDFSKLLFSTSIQMALKWSENQKHILNKCLSS